MLKFHQLVRNKTGASTVHPDLQLRLLRQVTDISEAQLTLPSHVVGYRGTALEPHHGGQALQRAGVCRTDGAGACLLWPHRSSVRSAQARASQTHKYDFLPVHAVHVAQETQRRHDLGVSVSECVRCSHCLARVPVSYVPTFSGTCAKPRLCSPGGLDTASLVANNAGATQDAKDPTVLGVAREDAAEHARGDG